LSLENKGGPNSSNRYYKSKNYGGNVGPFSFLSWSVPISSQPFDYLIPQLGFRGRATLIVGCLLWICGGLIALSASLVKIFRSVIARKKSVFSFL